MKTTLLVLAVVAASELAVTTSRGDVGLRDALQARLETSGLRLQPTVIPMTATGPDPEALLIELEKADGQTLTDISTAESRVLGRVGFKTVEVDSTAGLVRVDDARGYEVHESTEVSDQDLLGRAQPILLALGASSDETILKIRTLMRDSMSEDASSAILTERLAIKVIAQRVLAGYPVQGDRLILSYATDGTLRKIAGRWRTYDLHNSTFSTPLSRQVVAQRALDQIAAQRDLNMDSQESLRIHTRLVPRAVGVGGFRLDLIARVEVPIVAPGGFIYQGVDFQL